MGLKKFFKKAGKAIGDVAGKAAGAYMDTLGGPMATIGKGIIGGAIGVDLGGGGGGGGGSGQAVVSYLPAALPPGSMTFTKEQRQAMRARVRSNTRAALANKMDLAPGLPMDKVMIGAAVLAAGGALLYASKGR